MNALVPALVALLAQTDPAPAPAPAADAPAEKPAEKPAAAPTPGQSTALPGGIGKPSGMGAGKAISTQEVNRQLERLKNMAPEEASKEARKMAEDFGAMAGVKPPADTPEGLTLDSEGFSALSDTEQVKLLSRVFDQHIIAGDARNLVLLSGFPFQLEDRNVTTPEELHTEWLKNLRAKRTDVLTLYGVDVYTPAEMQKKYGPPPPRLAKLPLNQPKTFVTVSNLSGHAAIIVWRNVNGQWQAVGYTD